MDSGIRLGISVAIHCRTKDPYFQADRRRIVGGCGRRVMLIYGIDDDAAFNLLKWLSQEANIKLRVLAEQVSEDFRNTGPAIIAQSEFDQLLLTARLRVGRVDEPTVAQEA